MTSNNHWVHPHPVAKGKQPAEALMQHNSGCIDPRFLSSPHMPVEMGIEMQREGSFGDPVVGFMPNGLDDISQSDPMDFANFDQVGNPQSPFGESLDTSLSPSSSHQARDETLSFTGLEMLQYHDSSRSSEESLGPSVDTSPDSSLDLVSTHSDQSPVVTLTPCPPSPFSSTAAVAEQTSTRRGRSPGPRPNMHNLPSIDTGAGNLLTTGTQTRAGGLAPDQRGNEQTESANQIGRRQRLHERNSSVSSWLSERLDDNQSDPNKPGPPPQDAPTEAEIQEALDQIPSGDKTQNKYIPNTTYVNPHATTGIDETDIDIIRNRQAWEEGPRFAHINDATRSQPATSTEAIQAIMNLYSRNVGSTVSITPTVGTVPVKTGLSEMCRNPDDLDITSGNLFSKMSLSDRSNNNRRSSGVRGLIQNILKSPTSNSHKRSRSSIGSRPSSLDLESPREPETRSFIPRSPRHKNTPSIGHAFAKMGHGAAAIGSTHARQSSISSVPTTSVSTTAPGTAQPEQKTSAFSSLRGSLSGKLRGRSRSDVSRSPAPPEVPAAPMSATELFYAQAGSRNLPNTLFPPQAGEFATGHSSTPSLALENECLGDGSTWPSEFKTETNSFSGSSTEEIPNKDLKLDDWIIEVKKQLPFAPDFLVNRMAHHQDGRYKTLSEMRLKHSRQGTSCPNGDMCSHRGGRINYVTADGERRDIHSNGPSDGKNSIYHVSQEGFAPGIPKPPPVTLPAEFECPLCFKVKRFVKLSDWTKHVQEDVQPYTCSWQNCQMPRMFKRKADWVRHESEGHRHPEWWQCDEPNCDHRCFRRDNFLQHLVREHALEENRRASGTKNSHAGDPNDRVDRCHMISQDKPESEPCRICGKTFGKWKELMGDLASHMEEISYSVIAKANARVFTEDTVISPIREAPIHTFPVTAEEEALFVTGAVNTFSFNGEISGSTQPPFIGGSYEGIPGVSMPLSMGSSTMGLPVVSSHLANAPNMVPVKINPAAPISIAGLSPIPPLMSTPASQFIPQGVTPHISPMVPINDDFEPGFINTPYAFNSGIPNATAMAQPVWDSTLQQTNAEQMFLRQQEQQTLQELQFQQRLQQQQLQQHQQQRQQQQQPRQENFGQPSINGFDGVNGMNFYQGQRGL